MTGSEHQEARYRRAVAADQVGDDPPIGTLTELLRERAALTPDAPFLRFDEGEWTFAQVDEWTTRVAHHLTTLDGFGSGDRVAIMLPNVVEWPVVWLGALKAGAVVVPVNPGYRQSDLRHVLSDSGARIVVTDSERSELVNRVVAETADLAGTSVLESIGTSSVTAGPDRPHVTIDPTRLANLQYTSGTTGFPKACMLTHDYWVRLAWICAAVTGLGPDDVIMTSQPYSYMDPQWNTALALTVGAPLVVRPRFSASRFMSEARRFGVTFFYVLGSMPTLLLKQPPSDDDLDNDLRMVFCSGIPADRHAELERRWGAPWREIFGMTETGVDVFMPFSETGSVGSGSIGRPVPSKSVRIVDADDNEVQAGRPGEMVTRGRPMMEGYWNRPEETDAVLRDGWLHTGDIAVQDNEGRITLVGRIKDMVRRGGENVASVEVEDVLERDARIVGAAVVPVEDDVLGEEVKAFIQLAAEVEPTREVAASIRAAAADLLARFKVPRYVEFIDELPRTPSERVAKQVLKDRASDAGIRAFDLAARPGDACDQASVPSTRAGVRVDVVDDVAVLTLSRPEKLNALDVAARQRLAEVIRALGDGGQVRGIVITGEGRAFSAGEDLSVPPGSEEEFALAFETFHDVTRAILGTRVPVVAAVNGIAVGGASEITLCCDARIGAPSAEYFQPENARGLTISNASSILLPRLVGNHAMRMVLGSDRIDAEEALAIGLLDEVVPADELVQAAVDTVRRWNPPGSMTNLHLPLLRPLLEDVEAAFTREDVAGHEAWRSGALSAGVASWTKDAPTETTSGRTP